MYITHKEEKNFLLQNIYEGNNMNTEKQEFAALTEKQEWLKSQARKRAKRKKMLKYICGYTFVCVVATVAVTFLFYEKPYTIKTIAFIFLGAFLGTLIGCLLGKLGCCIIDQKKLNERKAVLPLSSEELQKLNIQTPNKYADWLNEYLDPCWKKELNEEQLEILELYHVYYDKDSRSYIPSSLYWNEIY